MEKDVSVSENRKIKIVAVSPDESCALVSEKWDRCLC